MAENKMDKQEFKFPDEEETSADFEIEIEDDTPPEDRDRQPLPKEMVQELEDDELEDYSEGVKERIKQMKKVYHDERREKEQAMREQQEALAYAKQIQEENRALKSRLSTGEQHFIDTYKSAAELEFEAAKRDYKNAYDMGDGDLLLDAQEKLNKAQFKLQKASEFVPSRQPEEVDVQPATIPAPKPDQRAVAWQERNTWWGTDPEMTASALGLHQKLVNERGPQYAGTDEYWTAIDKTMRRRFPDYFGEEEAISKPAPRESKPATVVAPASRSRSPKKIVLKQSQIAIAQRLGLTPEQYEAGKRQLEARRPFVASTRNPPRPAAAAPGPRSRQARWPTAPTGRCAPPPRPPAACW